MTRFTSGYLVVGFIAQRYFIVSMPLKTVLKSKKITWLIISIVIFISMVVNSWVLFLFELNQSDNKSTCGLVSTLENRYINVNIAYAFIIMAIPTIIIFTFNFLIISHTAKKKSFQINQCLNNQENKRTVNKMKLTKQRNYLYVAFNLPYLLVWFFYFFRITTSNAFDSGLIESILVALNVSEIIYTLNYSLKFYIYWIFNSVFKNKLDYTGNTYFVF